MWRSYSSRIFTLFIHNSWYWICIYSVHIIEWFKLKSMEDVHSLKINDRLRFKIKWNFTRHNFLIIWYRDTKRTRIEYCFYNNLYTDETIHTILFAVWNETVSSDNSSDYGALQPWVKKAYITTMTLYIEQSYRKESESLLLSRFSSFVT